ncbi:Potassium-transporting ATPase ATP-binding subunit [Candidatus Entotheonellaceae bacterium PAL068K]
MLVIELVVAGSTVYTGAIVYKKRQKKKKLDQFLQPQKKSEDNSKITPSSWVDETKAEMVPRQLFDIPSMAYDKTKTAIQRLTQDNIAPFLGDTRRQQCKALSSAADKRDRGEDEQKNDRKLLPIALISLGFATAGALVYPPLGLLSLPGVLYATMPLHKSTFKALKEGKVKVDTLATITVIGCLVKGYYIVLGLTSVFYSISSKLLLKIKDDSRKNLINVFKQHPSFVWVLIEGTEVETPFETVQPGDKVVVRAGELIPADGTITEGIVSVDQHILTGEAQPVEKEVGDQVFASTVVLSGKICIEVERAGAEATVAKIGEILNHTADFKSTTQLRSETLADRTVLPTLIAGGISLPFLGSNGALAVINAHFKYKMRILAPISILNFLNMASQDGILIKDGRTFDLLNQVDTIVFDKTGTLTEEQPYVGHIYTCATYDENEILIYAATAEHKQTHPIARAILQEAKVRRLSLPQIDDVEYTVGYGLTVGLDNQLVRVGSSRFMEMVGISIPPIMKETWAYCHNQGHSLVMVAINSHLVGAIELLPTVRPEAKSVISQLQKRRNITTMYIISGDHETPTKKLAQELGIDHYYAETLPKTKAELIEQLQAKGKFVCYVGDGINDSIALKKSQVSISLRGASTVATDTAQAILMNGRLTQLGRLFDLAQDFSANMHATFRTILVPMFIGMGGAFFLNFGLLYTVILNQVGLLAGVSNVMAPWFRYQRNGSKTNGNFLPKVSGGQHVTRP